VGTVGVVFDTNVLVSALGFGGTPLDAVLRGLQEDVDLLLSEATLAELQRVMTYDRLPFSATERSQFLNILRVEGTVVQPVTDVTAISEDPDDNVILAAAIAGDADYLVSGDDHLLALEAFLGVEICTPAKFLERI
jgi:putative PIN family toxin of toxin-antitoxin system